ncbi:MAG: ABC transporter permease, partial [Clostridia bacterium]|nr:ABC transporter permease [Clostridia bacterium]
MLNLKTPFGGIRALIADRRMLYQLMRNDLKARYAGSAFGMAWAFVQPLVSMMVMWAVFQVGFRSAPVDDIEFILWYIAANVPWIYYSDGVNASAGCLYEYSYLVKKMRFRTELLPLVKTLSATVTHTFFMAFSMFMLEMYGYRPQFIWLQIVYYSFAAFCLTLGLGWLVAAVSVFFKDFAHMTSIAIGIQFWLTPVLWGPAQMSDRALAFFKLNPMYYVT